MSEKVFVKLTEDELRSRGKLLAIDISMLVSAKEEKRESNREFNLTIKEIEKRIIGLAETIRSGQEERDAQLKLGAVRNIRAAE